jgi:hypothetical protein
VIVIAEFTLDELDDNCSTKPACAERASSKMANVASTAHVDRLAVVRDMFAPLRIWVLNIQYSSKVYCTRLQTQRLAVHAADLDACRRRRIDPPTTPANPPNASNASVVGSGTTVVPPPTLDRLPTLASNASAGQNPSDTMSDG